MSVTWNDTTDAKTAMHVGMKRFIWKNVCTDTSDGTVAVAKTGDAADSDSDDDDGKKDASVKLAITSVVVATATLGGLF